MVYKIPDTPEISYIKKNIPESAVVMSRSENFFPLKEYRNFLDSRVSINYGVDLRGESVDDLLAREKPIAVHMDEEFLNEAYAYKKYVMENGMIQVLPELWVMPEYFKEP